MRNNYWVNVAPEEFSSIISKNNANEATIEFLISPYDRPEAFRAYVADGKGIIEFKYIGEEESLKEELKDGLSLFVGRKSKRLYKIVLGLNELKNSLTTKNVSVDLRFINDKVRSAIEGYSDSNNFKAAEHLLDDKKNNIYRQLGVA